MVATVTVEEQRQRKAVYQYQYGTERAPWRLLFFKTAKASRSSSYPRVHFYLAAIRAVLEYAAPVWHHLLTKTHLDQLEAIQKRAIRILYQCNGITYANMLYFAQLSSLSSRREKLCRRFFNSITQPDSCLHTLLTPQRDPTIVTRLRAAAKYPPITTRTKKYQSFLSYALSKFPAT